MKVKEGSLVDIECSARGDPEPVVALFKKQGRAAALVDSPAYSFVFRFLSFRIGMAQDEFFQRKPLEGTGHTPRQRLVQVPGGKRR